MNRHGEFKRRYQRKPLRLWTWLAYSVTDEPRVVQTVDVAPEGVQFVDTSPLELRSVVLIRIWLNGETSPLECKGRVCWSRQETDASWRFGVRFLDLSADEHDLIEQRIYSLSAVA